MARKQIVEFDAAVSVASTDRFLLQQGAVGTDFTHATITQLLNAGLAATYSSVVVNGSAVPANGMYLPTTNTLGWAINSAAEMKLTASALSPATSNGLALGTTTLMWSDAFFASGSVLNFNNGDVTITHSAAALGIAGATVTVTRNSTDGSGTTTGLSILGAQSVAHTGTFYGASVTPSYSASSGNTLAALYGVSSTPANTGTGTVAAFFGVRGQPVNSSGGTVNSMRAVDGIPQNTSTGTVTDMYGVFARCDNSNAGGTVTNAYGFYVAAPVNSGTMVNRWGLYQVDTASKNLLAGRTLIGTTTDDGSTLFQVNGTFKATGASTLAAVSATTGAFSGNFAVATNKATINATTGETALGGSVTGASFIPFSPSLPTNGMYLPATNTLGWAVNTTAEMQMTGTALSPATSDGLALGTTTLMWSDAFFASGSVLNFNNGDVTLTHSSNTLTVAGGTLAVGALTATTGDFTGSSTINLSGTALSSISGLVLGGAAADAASTGVLMDAVAIHPRYVLRRANGTSASKTAVVADDVLGALEGRGYDGSAFTSSHAGIDFAAAENWSGADRGGKIAFRTTVNGTTTGAGVKMTLENSGALLIGGTTDDGVNKLRVSGGVTVDTGNSYKVNDVAVVGVRKTGWAAATGTATRTTFATTTVTTEQLAQRLKALIDDLISHGLIGT